jgi:RimJ/RimL family protein N-acetyltransferase
MRHDIVVEGYGFRLRPIQDQDAPFILSLRQDSELGRHLHPTPGGVEGQVAWLQNYYARPGDYYFVIERRTCRTPEGVISIYDIHSGGASGEWGRWILKKGSLAAVESAWMIYRCGLDVLGLSDVYCRTLADNASVVSFHDSCGPSARRVIANYFNINNQLFDAVEHRLNRADWPAFASRLDRLAMLTSRRIAHD